MHFNHCLSLPFNSLLAFIHCHLQHYSSVSVSIGLLCWQSKALLIDATISFPSIYSWRITQLILKSMKKQFYVLRCTEIFIFTTKKKEKNLTFCVVTFLYTFGFKIIPLIIILFYDFAIFQLMLLVCEPLAVINGKTFNLLLREIYDDVPSQRSIANKIELTRSRMSY